MAWDALISISKTDDGFLHVYAPITATSLDEAKEGAQFVLDSFASGKLAVIRTPPDATAEKDFDTDVMRYQGLVRFSFRDEPGAWHYGNQDLENGTYVGVSIGGRERRQFTE